MIRYLFPYEIVPKGSKIVLYAAGKIGIEYYYQLCESHYCEIVAWFDKDYESYQGAKIPVNCPEDIGKFHFDYIIIAVLGETYMEEIKQFLINKGIADEKIIWGKPTILGNRAELYIRSDSDNIKELGDYKRRIAPKELVNSNRLDIVIRYLYVRDICSGIINEYHRKMYARFILSVNGAEEPVGMGNFHDQFTDYGEKIGIDAFIESFDGLLESLKNEGFYEENAIPLNRNGEMLNGSHRVAASLALEKDIWVKYYDSVSSQDFWNLERLKRVGFSVEDQITILRGFTDLYENCGILVMMSEIEGTWHYVKQFLLQGFHEVGSVTVDFLDDYVAWQNILSEYGYGKEKFSNQNWMYKPFRFQLVIYSDEDSVDFKDLFEVPVQRLELLNKVMDFKENAVILATDKHEYEHLRRLFLSVNNFRVNGMRLRNVCGRRFENRLNKLRNFLIDNSIPIEKVCLTDEAVMEIFGLRQAKTIGVFFASDISVKNLKLPEGFDFDGKYGQSFWLIDDYHFLYHGFLVLSPQIVKDTIAPKNYWRHKSVEGVENSAYYLQETRDLRLLQLLLDYSSCFTHDLHLKEGMDFAVNRQHNKNYMIIPKDSR